MTGKIRNVDAMDSRLNVTEDNMFVGLIICEDLLTRPIGKLKCTKKSYSEKSLEIRFGTIPAKNTTI